MSSRKLADGSTQNGGRSPGSTILDYAACVAEYEAEIKALPAFEGLKAQKRWVAWRNEMREDKLTKVPYDPNTRRHARANDPSTWGTHAQAVIAAERLVGELGGGVGIQLGETDDGLVLVGIDLDTCRNEDGTFDPWAEAILLNVETYFEISPSATGAKGFMLVEPEVARALSQGRKVWRRGKGEHSPGIEVYFGGRYFTVTGRHCFQTPKGIKVVPFETLKHVIEVEGPSLAKSGGAKGNAAEAEPEGPLDPSRSAAAFRLGARVKQTGGDFDAMCAAIRDDPETADWYTEKGLPHDMRELRRIFDKVDTYADTKAEVVEEFNALYMVVREGGKTWVMSEQQHPITKRRFLDRMRRQDFELLYLNDVIQTSATVKGMPVFKTTAEFWLRHPDRRQYPHGVVFNPRTTESLDGVLNLWRGFAFEPKAGSWALMKAHLLRVVCSNVPTHFNYLMGWLATAVQHPDRRAGVAVVMRGDEGVGKGILGNAMVTIFGQHGLAICNAAHLVGKFNLHLRDCVLLFADEAFYAGDKAHVGILKAIITEPDLFIEGKNMNAEPAPNYLHPIMASNIDWVVPASRTARRFFVLDVPSTKVGDFDYFKKIMKQMEAGGYAAMLHDLLDHDLTNFDIREIPSTAGLQHQKELSLPTEGRWMQEVLYRGYVGHSSEVWVLKPPSEKLYAHYLTFAREAKEYQVLSQNAFGRKMKEMGFKPARTGGKGAQYHGYTLGTLADARAQFNKTQGVGIDWPEEEPPPKL